jgi:hypothetical protein
MSDAALQTEKRPPGRPAEIDEGRAVNVWLDAPSIKRAMSLGSGNISAGIRRALELAAKSVS